MVCSQSGCVAILMYFEWNVKVEAIYIAPFQTFF